MTVRTYSASVRVGNWNEDLHLEEDLLKDFLDKKEKGLLLIQQNTNLAATLVEKRELSITRDGYVHFGDVVSIFCEKAQDRHVFLENVIPREDCMLALDMSDESKFSQKLDSTSPVSATKTCQPALRSTFVIKSMDGAKDGTKLNYGQPFQLQTLDGAGNFYLHSDKLTFRDCAKKSRHQLLQLVNESSFNTHWQVLHKNPQVRLEFEFSPVPANEPIIINHCKTNRNLAVEQACTLRTEFGHEYEVSAHTYRDSHKADEDVNTWKIVMKQPGDAEHPVRIGSTTESPDKSQRCAPLSSK